MFTIGAFNVRGLKENSKLSKYKLINLINDCEKYHVDILAIQETHLIDLIEIKTTSNTGKPYKFINLKSENKCHGIGFIISDKN